MKFKADKEIAGKNIEDLFYQLFIATISGSKTARQYFRAIPNKI